MDDQAARPFCYLTTTGRVSGRPHTIEIWFARNGRTLYMLSGGGDRSDWVRNLLRDPEVTVRVGSRRAPELGGRARVVDPDSDEDELARALVTGKYQPTYGGDLSGWRREALPVAVDLEPASPDRRERTGATRLAAMADREDWTVERANEALPRVGAALIRIRELVEQARREREETAGLLEGNGHPATARGTDELRATVEALTAEGIVLRDLDAGLVDFPARLADGRQYLLCWVLGEPAVEWWHWPDAGFAGRRPLSDPPA